MFFCTGTCTLSRLVLALPKTQRGTGVWLGCYSVSGLLVVVVVVLLWVVALFWVVVVVVLFWFVCCPFLVCWSWELREGGFVSEGLVPPL